MRRRNKYALAFTLVLALTASFVGAGWAVDNPYVSTITRAAPFIYSNELTATVTTNPNGSYHYAYTLVFDQAQSSTQKLTTFSIGNLENKAFTNQSCSETSLLAAASTNSVLWNSGTVVLGTTVHFSYDSWWSYGPVSVTLAGGLPSGGTTLGMVPEPSSILAVAFGIGGVLWTRLRRRS